MRNEATLEQVRNAFRGLAKETALAVNTKQGARFKVTFDVHGNVVTVQQRKDGLLYVNAGGKAAVVSRSARAVVPHVVQALRAHK